MKTTFLKSFILIMIAGLMSLSFPTFASSGGGYGNSRKAVDHIYELGKAVFQGRRGEKINFCIDNGTEKVKLKGRSAKQYKGQSADDFFAALYDCNQPDTQVAATVKDENAYALVYYFNKRYRLNLKGL